MTTKELLKKAHKIASKYFDVTDILFKQTFHSDTGLFTFDLTCFYNFKDKESNFSTNRWLYTVDDLLTYFEQDVKEEARALYPKSEALQTTDLEISEPKKTNDHESNG